MIKSAWLALLMIPALSFGQSGAPDSSSQRVTKLLRVHYGNARNLAELAANSSGVNVQADNALQAIVLRGKASDVATVEQMVKELDTAAASTRDFELTIWAIGGSNDSDSQAEGQVPDSLMPVAKQLRAIFPYKNYQVLSTMLIRSREGTKARNDGVMHTFSNIPNFAHPSTYTVEYGDSTISAEERSTLVHLSQFRFVTRVPVGSSAGQWQNEDVSIDTDVDLHEGQKIVVGKANVGNSDSALFIVLSARLVQ